MAVMAALYSVVAPQTIGINCCQVIYFLKICTILITFLEGDTVHLQHFIQQAFSRRHYQVSSPIRIPYSHSISITVIWCEHGMYEYVGHLGSFPVKNCSFVKSRQS